MKEERQQILYKKKRTSDGRTRREVDGIAEAEGKREERKDGMETETGREGAAGRWRRRRTHKRLREEE